MRYCLAGLFLLIFKCELSEQQNEMDEDETMDNKGFDKIVFVIPVAGILLISILGCLSYLIYTCKESRRSDDSQDNAKDNPAFVLGQPGSAMIRAEEEFSYTPFTEPPPPHYPSGNILAFNATVHDPPPSYYEAVQSQRSEKA